MHVSLQEQADSIKRKFQAIPEVKVMKAVYGMKNKAAKLVQVEERALEGGCISSKRVDIYN
jgi:hypothetical protein